MSYSPNMDLSGLSDAGVLQAIFDDLQAQITEQLKQGVQESSLRLSFVVFREANGTLSILGAPPMAMAVREASAFLGYGCYHTQPDIRWLGMFIVNSAWFLATRVEPDTPVEALPRPIDHPDRRSIAFLVVEPNPEVKIKTSMDLYFTEVDADGIATFSPDHSKQLSERGADSPLAERYTGTVLTAFRECSRRGIDALVEYVPVTTLMWIFFMGSEGSSDEFQNG